MSVSLSIDLIETRSNQDVSTESHEDYTLDPVRELIGTLGCCSAVGFSSFLAHKVKISLSISIENIRVIYLIDIRTIFYIITLIGALVSIRISICSNTQTVYPSNNLRLWCTKKDLLGYNDYTSYYGEWFKNEKDSTYNTEKSEFLWADSYDIQQKSTTDFMTNISTTFLIGLSLILPLFIYGLLNSQLILL